MSFSLVAGVGLAVGHHVFYWSLAGHEPSTKKYDFLRTGLSGQQINLTVGATFAFLVKAFLSIVVSTGQDQSNWQSIRRRPTKITAVDELLQSRTNIFYLFRPKLWSLDVLSMALALVYW